MQWNLRRGLELALFLLSICAVQSDTSNSSVQPSDHGLSNEKDPDDPSPAMVAFFGAHSAAPIPLARNTTDPIWGVDGKVSPAEPPSNGILRRTMLLAAGVVCALVGLGLLVSAAAYTVRIRNTSQLNGTQNGIGQSSSNRPTRRKSRQEIRLGPAP